FELCSFLSIDRRRHDRVEKRSWPPLAVKRSTHFVVTRGAICREPHIVFARPQHFHGTADCFRDERRLDAVVVLQSSAESTTEKGDVDLDLFGIESHSGGYRISHILWNLCRSPQFTLVSLKMCRAISWLHGGVRHKR